MKMNVERKKIFFIMIIVLFFCVSAGSLLIDMHRVSANDVEVVPVDGKADGDYGLNDFVLVFVNISRIIFGLSGSAALLMLVLGGAMFIASGGNEGKVDSAKKIMSAAFIGLLIIFCSFMIIQFTLQGLGVVDDGGVFKAFSGNKWFQLK